MCSASLEVKAAGNQDYLLKYRNTKRCHPTELMGQRGQNFDMAVVQEFDPVYKVFGVKMCSF